MVTVIGRNTPVASAMGGGFITAGGDVVRASSIEAGFQTDPGAGSGGGGGSSTPTPTPTEEELQMSLPADLRDLSVAEVSTGRTIQSQLQDQPQQDFGDTSLQSRIPTAQPSIVGLPPSLASQALGLGRDEKQPRARFTPDLLKSSARQFFFEGGTPLTAVSTLASPFQGLFTKRKSEQEFFEPQFGTISSEQPTGFKKTTGIEKQREQALINPSLLIPADVLAIRGQDKISKELGAELQLGITDFSKELGSELTGKFQKEIDTGGLTLSQAEKAFEKEFSERTNVKIGEAEKEFEKEFAERFETEVIPSFGKRQEFISDFEKGRKPVVNVPAIAELGAIGLGSLTPTGQSLIGASFVAEGLPKITGGDTLLERGIGVVEIGIGLGTGGLVTKGIERSADRLLIKELQSLEGILTGKEIARFTEGQLFLEAPEIGGVIGLKIPKGGGRGSVFETTTLRNFGQEAKLTTDLRSIVFETGLGKFSTTGRGTSTLDFFSFEKGKPITIVEQFKFGAKPKVSELPPRLGKFPFDDEVKGVFGTGFVQRKGLDKFAEFEFGGAVLEIKSELGTFSQIQSGKATGVGLDIFEGNLKGGFFKVPISERGAIKRLNLPISDLDVGFVSPAKIKKTSLDQTFQQIQSPPPIGISKSIEIFQTPTTQTAFVSRSLIGIPRATGGAGLTQQQIQRGQGRGQVLVQQEFIQPLTLSRPDSSGGLIQPGLIQPDLIVGRGRQKDAFGVGSLDKIITTTGIGSKALQIPETKLDTKQIQKQFQVAELSSQFSQLTPPPITPTGFGIGRGFGFDTPFFFPPPIVAIDKGRGRVIKRGKRTKTRIAPSFTGNILELEIGIPETTILGGIDIGILPGQIRGIAKRKKKKVSKKKTSKKKKK